MTKKLYLFASFLLSVFWANAQLNNIDPETQKVLYQETVTIDSLKKEQIFKRAYDWMTNNFKTNKFDVNDKVNYKLANEGSFPLSYTYDFKYKSNNTVTYSFTIEIKDGKYRYTFKDFKVYDDKLGPKTSQPVEAAYQKMKSNIKKEFSNKFNAEIENIINDLKKGISSAPTEESEDW